MIVSNLTEARAWRASWANPCTCCGKVASPRLQARRLASAAEERRATGEIAMADYFEAELLKLHTATDD